MLVTMVLKTGLRLSLAIFITACSHTTSGQNEPPHASNLIAAPKAQLARPKSSCEQVYQPIHFVDQTTYIKMSAQLQQWVNNQHLKSEKQLTATLIQLPAKKGDRVRARLFVDQVAIWPTTLLLENSSGQLAAVDPSLMKKLISAEFEAFHSDENDVIEHSKGSVSESAQWMDSCRVYDIGNNAASVAASWLINFQQGLRGHSVEINDHSMQVVRTWPLARD